MSIETYEMLNGKLELYHLLDEGRAAVKEGRKRPLADVMRDIRQEIADGEI
jgi:PHD/YefM family antitoxin component YafN of YafNO toxin-antitoxin module